MIIDFEGIKNTRDLGNIQNSEGMYIKSRRLIRGADLSDATSNDLKRLKNEYDVGAVVDFRDIASIRRKPDRRIEGAAYYSCPALSLMNFSTEEESLLFDEAVKRDPLGMLYEAYRALAEDSMAHEAYRTFFSCYRMQGAEACFGTALRARTGLELRRYYCCLRWMSLLKL